MIVLFMVCLDGVAYVDIDRCEVLPETVDDSMPYPENEPCSEECFLHLVYLSRR
jgi:hypothetical protein